MGFGDVIGLLLAMGELLGVIGIASGAYHRRLAHKERMAELRSSAAPVHSALPSPEQAQLIEKLEHRVRVLERIATDKSAKLANEIEDLRQSADAT